MKRLVIFASGRGSNARAIIEYFKSNGKAQVVSVVTNKPDAPVLEIAKAYNIPSIIVDKQTIDDPSFAAQIDAFHPSLIVLAGFLWKVPNSLTDKYPDKIVNIHPALLPKFGGKGMYGARVHQAVLDAGESCSGITIHYVNEHYDEGAVIVQAQCPVSEGDDASILAGKVGKLEHFFYPRTIEYLLENNKQG